MTWLFVFRVPEFQRIIPYACEAKIARPSQTAALLVLAKLQAVETSRATFANNRHPRLTQPIELPILEAHTSPYSSGTYELHRD